MTMPTTTPTEPDERPVEEVHCAESNVPLPSIPAWYATVDVKFVSNNVRKSNALTAGLLGETETPRAADAEAEAEPALDDTLRKMRSREREAKGP
jgi:hypothetical protein